MSEDYASLDIASHLDSDEVIAEYLTAAAEEEDPRVLLAAMSEVAKARGLTDMATVAGRKNASLTAELSGQTRPSFETVRAVLRGLGVRLAIEPARQSAAD